MTYPRTLHLTEDGTPIVVQRKSARAVATAARAAVGDLTINDVARLSSDSFAFAFSTDALVVVVLAEWIARSLDLDDAAIAEARRLAGRRGVPR